MFQIWGYTEQICTIYTAEKTTRKVTKNWSWPFLISQALKISNINTGHKFKNVWNTRYKLQTRIVKFNDQKKIAKKLKLRINITNWNWPCLISQLLKISNINTGHKFKIVWNMRHNLHTRHVQFTDQKKVWICTNSTN